jgi:predicted metal-dependent phosphoesterase TrpH
MGRMRTRYDLHSHSLASDGTLSPAELVAAAHAAGVDVLALTDHDTMDGIAEATDSARQLGLQLVPGAEISVSWRSQTIHVLALGIDPACDELRAGLAGLEQFRHWRAEEMGRRLEKKE